jgi:hypothetical protein
MIGRFSLGWNFHHTRKIKTFGLAVSFVSDRVLLCIGPLMFVWLKRYTG